MQKYRRAVTGGIAVLGLAAAALTAVTSVPAAGANQPRGHRLVALAKSRPQTSDTKTGSYTSRKMSIEVALAPGHEAALSKRLAAVYDPSASQYHHWLRKGQFDAMYAPSAAARSAVSSYLTAHGLVLGKASTPFLVRASGSSAQVTAAFHTQLNTFTGRHGQKYFSNSTAVKLPSALAAKVTGIIGLSNTVRAHMSVKRTPYVRHVTGKASCEAPYPTRQQLFKAVNQGVGFPFGYGAAPGCNGLTPSQLNSLYGAPHVGARGKGAGQNVAVFELSGYRHSDVATFTHQFYGAGYQPPLVDINVDGGPINPVCPAGDTCPPDFNGYAGDVEVVADIETELAAAPAVKHLLVYNAPNDNTGQTELDEYARIAGDDSAASISSSWGLCENDVGAGYAQAENVLFEQLAMQGQSMFGGSGDTGAFGCIRSDGTTILNLVDPPSQPWVTSVGGTSFETYNPGTKPNPSYPRRGEAVWNVQNLCNDSAEEGQQTGYFWCAAVGAGGGGSSQFWGRPSYQHGPGITSADTTYGNGTTQCSLAATGTPCRETPDVSADADEFTPYAEYCTGSATTNSACATFTDNPPGWFGIGGTSLSSPFWAAIAVDRASYSGHRVGNLNPGLYRAYRNHAGRFFHDVTARRHIAKNNGFYRAKRGYDLATGIGTPKMAALIRRAF
jgi:subtilase family serine protease